MWFVLLLVISGLGTFVWYKTQNHEKQLERDAYNEKVKSFNEAKELLKSNKRLMSSYTKLVDIYENEKFHNREEKTKVVIEIMSQSNTTQVATAVCALAKIESNRRLNKNVTKS